MGEKRGMPEVTYNFDPDRWYQNQRGQLDQRLANGELDAVSHGIEIEKLDRRLEEMETRLDGSYPIPKKTDTP
jgi:hypothetical protein